MYWTKEKVAETLENYNAERESIPKMLAVLDKDADDVLYPSSSQIDDVVIQNSYSQSRQIDSLISRADKSRSYYINTLKSIKKKSQDLDRLIYCVERLKSEHKQVILNTLIEDETVEAFAAKQNISLRTAQARKQEALEEIAEKMNLTDK